MSALLWFLLGLAVGTTSAGAAIWAWARAKAEEVLPWVRRHADQNLAKREAKSFPTGKPPTN